MKVLYLTPGCFDKGGISRYSRFQIQALREIVGDDNVRTYSLLPRQAGDFEDKFDVTWSPGTTVHALNKAAFAFNILACTLAWRPDVIWTAHVNISGFALLLAKLVKARTVLNTYGLEVWSGLSAIRELGLKRSENVMSDCHFTAQYLVQAGYRTAGTVSVVWDTVDVQRFFPATAPASVLTKYGIPDPSLGINLMTLGRMTSASDHKGYRRLLEAFSIAARELDALHLVYAGSGDLIDGLRERARELGLSSRVHFLGSIHEDDLPNVYRCAHIFALISDRGTGRGEGVPVTPLEAAACGVPILVGDQDGSPEAVVQGENGYVLDSLDIEAHAAAILQLARDPEARARMGTTAARRIDAEFSYGTFREKHRKLVEAIAQNEENAT
jgi:phosphatidylinositol alpha-1,6-mannosyltransferase